MALHENWNVYFTSKASKQKKGLPDKIQFLVDVLAKEIEIEGPLRKNWKHFGALADKKTYHCHLKQGRPTYVACWSVEDKNKKWVEIYYVGTHENAPY